MSDLQRWKKSAQHFSSVLQDLQVKGGGATEHLETFALETVFIALYPTTGAAYVIWPKS